jgi:hypothetical protein
LYAHKKCSVASGVDLMCIKCVAERLEERSGSSELLFSIGCPGVEREWSHRVFAREMR